jgi:hypothetical protein
MGCDGTGCDGTGCDGTGCDGTLTMVRGIIVCRSAGTCVIVAFGGVLVGGKVRLQSTDEWPCGPQDHKDSRSCFQCIGVI